MTTRPSLTIRIHWSLGVTFLGALAAVGSLLLYEVFLSALIRGSRELGLLEEISYITLVVVFAGLVLIFVGITSFLRGMRIKRVQPDPSSWAPLLTTVLGDRLYSKIFLISAVAYGILFGMMSGTFVYQPGASFSGRYGVAVPSVIAVVCCGKFGEMPQLVIYLTQNFAILLVPINLILQLIVSWLVGLNAGIATFAYMNRKASAKVQWFSVPGAIVGLFTACPTCGGLFLLTILGLTGALAMTLASLQEIFVLVGIPLLMITPIMSARRSFSGGPHLCAPLSGGYSAHKA